MSQYIGQNIIIARESRKKSQATLAQESGVAQGTISKIEIGQQNPSDDILDKIATALNYPKEFFLEEFYYKNLPITFFRKRKIVPKSKTTISKIKADINIFCLHLKKLLQSVEIPECKIPFLKNCEEVDPESLAKEIRLYLNLADGPISDLSSLLEKNGIVIIPYDFDSEKFDGFSFYHYSENLPPIIFINKFLPGDRQRFTLAHEFGHLVMHCLVEFPNENSEKEADEFAAEFLMPRLDIAGYLEHLNLERLMQLKSYWRVSMQALIVRAKNLQRLGPYQERMLWQKISMYGYKKNEPIKIAEEKAKLLFELIDVHRSELKYSQDELNNLLHIYGNDFEEKYSSRRLRAI